VVHVPRELKEMGKCANQSMSVNWRIPASLEFNVQMNTLDTHVGGVQLATMATGSTLKATKMVRPTNR
jgi:hypothetical protein